MRHDLRPSWRRKAVEPPRERVVVDRVHAVIQADRRLDPRARRLSLAFAANILTLDGEVGDLASKKRTLRDAASVPEVRWIVDRVRVAPSTPMEDGEIRRHLRDALVQESEFDECKLLIARNGIEEAARDPSVARGSIRIEVTGGVVTLDGDVPSWSHRRFAGVLAWWVPGTRDVENRLGVVPSELDNDGEVSDAVRLVLERDPLVDAAQIRVGARGGRVALMGTVASEGEKRIAERDAWYVLGVDEVENEIAVAAKSS